uniref:AlNc14C142G7277 protein n=1 Tax=Albugo laibachii Nc14 TaxID=890382 RepID=F0WL88_9STRA|nr:AlNc14C142G7277 [Albugo laibachii Nc14]|eukprot:CCA22050.1 AlNc14C142G7277 [Albugo laibachii Nc14]
MKLTSKDKENNVILFLKNRLSYREIATRLNIGRSTVYDIAKRNGFERQSNKGDRQLKIPEVIKRNIIRKIISGKCDTAVKAAEMLRHDFNIDVSAQTVRNVLKVAGLQAKHKIKKPSISAKIQKKRLEFAKTHQHWIINV